MPCMRPCTNIVGARALARYICTPQEFYIISVAMGKLLSHKQREKLIKAHKKEYISRYSDRIKAILHLDWPVHKIAEALLVDENTIRNYKERFLSGGISKLCRDAHSGRECSLSDEELAELESELRASIYLSSKEVVSYVKKHFGIKYTVNGITEISRNF